MIASDGTEVIEAATRAVERARSPAQLVSALAETLAGSVSVDRVSVRTLSADARTVTVVALWTPHATTIPAGTSMSVLSTSIPELIRTGKPVIGNADQKELLEAVLLEDGIRAWASMPIIDEGRLRAVVSISSRRLDAYSESDTQFFTELCDSISRSVLTLIPD